VADDYRAAVKQVVALLDLERDDVMQQFAAEIDSASESLEFERTQRLRRDLEVLTRLRDEQQALASMALQSPYLIVQPGAGGAALQLLLVIEGRWWAQVALGPDSRETAVRRLEDAWRRYLERGIDPVDHAAVDEANIIARWRMLEASSDVVIEIERP